MIHEALRLLRAYHDLSQNECCVRLGFSKGRLARIESGEEIATESVIGAYSLTFGVPVSSIHFFSERSNGGITEGVRIKLAKKVISLLQWIEARNERRI
ncbi:helix-turn-helix domain-containing protein [Azohydromonas caseinilytica]|uniref:Helix-turn-helix domain-containing protein n=1 Tax=Azohydromonas caseinilytica TaxID=2728836 RepID=A0A848FIT6_9BURK|nr:helix-turn-helix transcriptional regulator [Azohydromonas caseinilytica]NML19056.1 helix-turn-helix domain-containing protein [Azohydromonas caseinilytica]